MIMKWTILFLISAFCFFQNTAYADELSLDEEPSSSTAFDPFMIPSDSAVVAKVVHGVKYPLNKKFVVGAGLARFYGDRLASTWGYGIEPRFNLSEKVWLALPVYFLRPSADDGIPKSDSTVMNVSDPSMVISGVAGFNPIYGKFVLNETIYHFRSGFNLGLGLMKSTQISGGSQSDKDSGWQFNGQAGLQLQLQLNRDWLLEGFSQALLYKVNEAPPLFSFLSEIGLNRLGWLYGIRVGRVF